MLNVQLLTSAPHTPRPELPEQSCSPVPPTACQVVSIQSLLFLMVEYFLTSQIILPRIFVIHRLRIYQNTHLNNLQVLLLHSLCIIYIPVIRNKRWLDISFPNIHISLPCSTPPYIRTIIPFIYTSTPSCLQQGFSIIYFFSTFFPSRGG